MPSRIFMNLTLEQGYLLEIYISLLSLLTEILSWFNIRG
jgi:hypothetical protein